MITIRPAQPDDLDFLVEADLITDGWQPQSDEEAVAHRQKIAAFAGIADDAGWVAVHVETGAKVGAIMVCFHDPAVQAPSEANQFLFRYLPDEIFPRDGRFCEIYQLWVAPEFRRQGIATRLKQQAEEETRRRGMEMLYTHTETRNANVIELNRKLGYEVARVGPIWDDVSRTSLVKRLTGD